jgi:hypothetical protein
MARSSKALAKEERFLCGATRQQQCPVNRITGSGFEKGLYRRRKPWFH